MSGTSGTSATSRMFRPSAENARWPRYSPLPWNGLNETPPGFRCRSQSFTSASLSADARCSAVSAHGDAQECQAHGRGIRPHGRTIQVPDAHGSIFAARYQPAVGTEHERADPVGMSRKAAIQTRTVGVPDLDSIAAVRCRQITTVLAEGQASHGAGRKPVGYRLPRSQVPDPQPVLVAITGPAGSQPVAVRAKGEREVWAIGALGEANVNWAEALLQSGPRSTTESGQPMAR